MSIVLITGASSGVGFETAVAFAEKGHHVIATMRNLANKDILRDACEKRGSKIEILQLDITNQEMVDQVVQDVLNRYQRIDVLINNAGAGCFATLEQLSISKIQSTMDVNFLGTVRMTKAVLPSMRQNKSGKIISVSSVGGVVGQPFNDAYCAAKFALEGVLESFAPVAKRLGVSVSLVEPGPIHSQFVASTRNESPTLSDEISKDYSSMIRNYSQATQEVYNQFCQSSVDIAKLLLAIAETDQPNFRYQTSEFSEQVVASKLCDPTGNAVLNFTGKRLDAMTNAELEA